MRKIFGFVLLNYVNYQETIECVESILALSGENYFIVIVDNASPNGSLGILRAEFSKHEKIRIVSSERNGGYSSGNNKGIKILHGMGIFDVIIATSDTKILSKEFLQKLERLDVDGVGVVGPRIVNLGGEDQNPMLWGVGLDYIVNIHFPGLASFFRNSLYSMFPKCEVFVKIWKDSAKKEAGERPVYMVHGSFLYLTRNYFEKCGLLDESLFMYGEEDLIAFNCSRKNLKTLFIPEIEVLHKEAKSTPRDGGRSFTLVHSSKSLKYLKQKLKMATLFSIMLRGR